MSAQACCCCGAALPSVLVTDSRGQVRLAKCEKCGNVADVYWSHGSLTTIVLIDILLHRPPAYRHLLCNFMPSEARRTELLCSALAVLVACDVALKHSLAAVLRAEVPVGSSSGGNSSSTGAITPLQEIALSNAWPLLSSLLEFACLSAVASRVADALAGIEPRRSLPLVAEALLLSSVGKSFTLLLMIWRGEGFPYLFFGAAVELLTLSCNFCALRVLQLTSRQAAASLAVATTARGLLAALLLLSAPKAYGGFG